MENLFNPEHKCTNEKYDKNYEKSFGLRCVYHGTRLAFQIAIGKPLCRECYNQISKQNDK